MLKRRLRSLALLFGLAFATVTLAAQTPKPTDTVYVTKTGGKYHRAGCSSLRLSRIAISLEEASARYGACLNCKPPVLTVARPAVEPPRTAAPVERLPAAKSVKTATRCQATTKKGTQCLRNAKAGSHYCWQHGG